MAGLDRFRVVVGTGHGGQAGVVVRRPGVLVVASVSRPETIETTKRLLALCAEVTSEAGSPATTGSRLVRRVAGLLVDAEAERVPDFGLLTTVNDRIAALVHGAMDVVTGGPTPVSLSGVDSATWVDRLLPLETTRVDIGPTEAMPSLLHAGLAGLTGLRGLDDLGFPLDLRVGAVPGTAASLIVDDDAAVAAASLGSGNAFLSGFEPPREPMTEAAPIPTPGRRMPDQLSTAPPALTPLLSKDDEAHRRLAAAAEPTQAADFDELDEDPPTTLAARELAARSQGHDGHGTEHRHDDLHDDDLHDDLDDDQDALTQLPGDPTFTVSDLIEDDDAETMLPNAAQPQVEGIMCANGHFNHPQAPYCAECGISLAQQTNRTVFGPRPPIGVLVFDDGQTVNVDMDLVIGRQPDRDEAVRAGNARPLPVEDGESAVSRVHAVITLNGWDAVITDRGSANGTYIAPPEATVWTPLSPHQPAPLVPGTRVQVGKRTFVFNSHIQV